MLPSVCWSVALVRCGRAPPAWARWETAGRQGGGSAAEANSSGTVLHSLASGAVPAPPRRALLAVNRARACSSHSPRGHGAAAAVGHRPGGKCRPGRVVWAGLTPNADSDVGIASSAGEGPCSRSASPLGAVGSIGRHRGKCHRLVRRSRSKGYKRGSNKRQERDTSTEGTPMDARQARGGSSVARGVAPHAGARPPPDHGKGRGAVPLRGPCLRPHAS